MEAHRHAAAVLAGLAQLAPSLSLVCQLVSCLAAAIQSGSVLVLLTQMVFVVLVRLIG
jgi:hypothetical protein